MNSLPVDAHLRDIVAAARTRKRVIVVAPPGSGKTTRIPPALVALGRTILLQPRRVAARALARRIAWEQGWTIGNEIGWQIRFERKFSDKTRLLVATEGILTARLQSDPLLSDFDVVILDEFHERSIHADLALALARQAALSRPELVLVVMSATIDPEPLAAFLEAPVISVDARPHPIEIRYMPGTSVADAVRGVLPDAQGHILCFLPGAREIERAANELARIDARVLPLHGRLDVDAQERALAPSSERKVILATNVAETSLTVDGVTDVIDGGLHKVLRFDAETAVDHLVTEQIAADSATQRAGRAGRTGPGRATRLWDERMILRERTDPEVRRIDLAATVLDVIAWGGDPETFEWFEHPPQYRLDSAIELLRQLGAIEGRTLTAVGAQLREFPLHPRLARMIVAANGSREAIELAAEISEGRVNPDVVRDLVRIGAACRVPGAGFSVERAALAAYPDRVAMRRSPDSPALLLSSGTGATLAREIAHLRGEFFVAMDVRGDWIHRALPVEREWLTPTHTEKVHTLDGTRVRAVQRNWYGALLLHEQTVAPDASEAQKIAAAELARRGDPELQLRARIAGIEIDWAGIAQRAAGANDTAIRWQEWLPHDVRSRLDELAPLRIPLPSGRTAALEYREDGSVLASAKLQELFGMAETPRIGRGRIPITFSLLAPNGRPVQVTQDLRNFWNTTYQEVRKELRGRYAKHPWPEDPWTAPATHRAKRR